eukprot:SAG11_NODE_132_length_15459_cov_61.061979_5_plen_262_part_00
MRGADGFGGGLWFQGNLLFNVVQDTGEHGVTNSWDRQPMLYTDPKTGAVVTAPATRTIMQNFIFRNSFRGPTSNKWGLDKDDGSSNYDEAGNVIMYGGIKDRDGLWRVVRDNLIVFPERMPHFVDTTQTFMAMAFQTNEFGFDFFQNNTVISTSGFIYACSAKGNSAFPPTNASNLRGNTFIYPTLHGGATAAAVTLPFQGSGCMMNDGGSIAAGARPAELAGAATFAAWQAAGFDAGSIQEASLATAEQLVAMVGRWLPL